VKILSKPLLSSIDYWMKYILLILVLGVTDFLYGQSINYKRLASKPATYDCRFIPLNRITCDGKLSEPEWESATWTSNFIDIEGTELPAPAFLTRAKVLWDDSALYVAAEMIEPHIWAYQNTRDDIIYRENDFEVFISGDTDNPEYYEIEINALNNILDLLLAKPYRDGGKPDLDWDVQSLQTGVDINGTINDASDEDSRWTVEIKIPFKSLDKHMNGKLPQAGDIWRINFSRVEYDIEIRENRYYRKKSENGQLLPEHNWVWSPQGLIDMHFPERWGYLKFIKKQGPQIPDDEFDRSETIKQVLWMVYYAQRTYFKEHRKYATALTQLGYPAFLEKTGLPVLPLELRNIETGYLISVHLPVEKLHLSLDHTGIFR
jgi:hypothetical protein